MITRANRLCGVRLEFRSFDGHTRTSSGVSRLSGEVRYHSWQSAMLVLLAGSRTVCIHGASDCKQILSSDHTDAAARCNAIIARIKDDGQTDGRH